MTSDFWKNQGNSNVKDVKWSYFTFDDVQDTFIKIPNSDNFLHEALAALPLGAGFAHWSWCSAECHVGKIFGKHHLLTSEVGITSQSLVVNQMCCFPLNSFNVYNTHYGQSNSLFTWFTEYLPCARSRVVYLGTDRVNEMQPLHMCCKIDAGSVEGSREDVLKQVASDLHTVSVDRLC